MLELYHWEPDPGSLKMLICLHEKGLAFASRYVDAERLEQYSEDHRRLAPQGQLPVLVDDGEVMNDSSFALQYLAEAYPTPRLAPTDPAGWYDLQAWNNLIDAGMRAAVALIGWQSVSTPERREAHRRALAAIPGRQPAAGWDAVVADAEATEDQIANARERIEAGIARIEAALAASDWLVGGAYSIADINSYALVQALPRLLPDLVNEARTPRTMAWLDRIGARPAVKEALAMRTSTRPGAGDCFAPPI